MQRGRNEDESPGQGCPIPISDYPRVLLAHGGGGTLMQDLIGRLFRRAFDNPRLRVDHDGALLEPGSDRLAFTTDSFVVQPLFFPGGDIGSLAVNGTVNDLAMCGARPLWLSAGFILEEGLEMETLWRVARSMGRAAAAAGVEIVTGDTKVVERGKGDGVFINTAGLGRVESDRGVDPRRVAPGDRVLVNGALGRHGMAVLAARGELEFEGGMASDCAPLAGLVLGLLEEGIDLHCMRDLTRGGLAGALNEIARAAQVGIVLEEREIPVDEAVRGACEFLGFDPLYVANEGRFVAFVSAEQAERALERMRGHELGRGARLIGEVGEAGRTTVTARSPLGPERVVGMLSGEQLPRIC
jgi:hydrogenase expression/formation protein HypE